MSRGTIFGLLRYLALSVAEGRTTELSKEQLKEKLEAEGFDDFNYNDANCAYELYLKYIEEYTIEVKYNSNFML
jgi:hypothetical protein